VRRTVSRIGALFFCIHDRVSNAYSVHIYIYIYIYIYAFYFCPNMTKYASEVPFKVPRDFRIRVANACEYHKEVQGLRGGGGLGEASGTGGAT